MTQTQEYGIIRDREGHLNSGEARLIIEGLQGLQVPTAAKMVFRRDPSARSAAQRRDRASKPTKGASLQKGPARQVLKLRFRRRSALMPYLEELNTWAGSD